MSNKTITFKILRQDGPNQPSYWETFVIPLPAKLERHFLLDGYSKESDQCRGKKSTSSRLGVQLSGRSLRNLHHGD